MPTLVYVDGLAGTLDPHQGIQPTDVTMQSASLAGYAHNAGCPVITSGQEVRVTLFDLGNDGISIIKREDVLITAHASASNQATILRGQNGTTAQSWSAGSKWVAGWESEDVAAIYLAITAAIATAAASAASTYVPLTAVGAHSGVAALDSSGLVPFAQLPALVDTFNGRTGSVSLSKADITGTGLTYSDVGADAAGAAVTAVATSEAYANATFVPLAGGVMTGALTLSGAPTSALHAATKAYVDGVAQGLSVKPSVIALAATNQTLSGLPTVDGITLTANQRILLTGQSTSSQNGIWQVSSGAWVRPSDFAHGATEDGAFVFVESGTTYGGSGFVLTGTGIVVDTNAQSWSQFSGAGEIVNGTGLTKVGNTLSITNTTVTAGSYGAGDHTLTASINAQGQWLSVTSIPIAVASSQVTDLPTVLNGYPTKANNLSDIASTVTALKNLGIPIFSVLAYGADATGATDSTTAFTLCLAACKAVGGPAVFYVPGGTYLCNTGVLTRTTITDAQISFVGDGNSQSIVNWNAGNGIGIDTEMTGVSTAYWFSSGAPYFNARPIAPVAGITFNLQNLTAGGIGVRHGPGIGGFYDCYILNGTGLPSDNGTIITNPGVRGFQMRNGTDFAGGQRYTEETVFGPNFGVENCYVCVEADAYTGTSSFGYTHMMGCRIRIAAAGQTGLVIRNSNSTTTGAQLYNGEYHIRGNLSQVVGGLGTTAGAYYNAQQTIGSLTALATNVTTTATWTNGATAITVASNTGIVAGQLVTGTNIAAGTTVTSVVGTTVNIDTPTTGIGSATTVNFGALLIFGGGTSVAVKGGTTLQLGSDSGHQVTVAAKAGTSTLAEYGYWPSGSTTVPITGTYSGSAGSTATVVTANGGNVACVLGTISGTFGGGSVTSITLAANLPFKLYDGQLIRVTDLNSGVGPNWTGSQVDGNSTLFMVSGLNLTGQATINVYAHTPIDDRHVTYTYDSGSTHAASYRTVTVELMSSGIVVGWAGNTAISSSSNFDGATMSGGLHYRVENGSNHIVNTVNLFVSKQATFSCSGHFNGDTFSSAPSQIDGTLAFAGTFTSTDYSTSSGKVYLPIGEQKSSRGVLANGSIEVVATGIGNGIGYPTNTTGGMYVADSPDGGALYIFAPNTNIHLRPLGGQTSTGEVILRSTSAQFTATGTHTFSGAIDATAGGVLLGSLSTATTQAANINNTTVATTAYADRAATSVALLGDVTGSQTTTVVGGLQAVPLDSPSGKNAIPHFDGTNRIYFQVLGGDLFPATALHNYLVQKIRGVTTNPSPAAAADKQIFMYSTTDGGYEGVAVTGDITLGAISSQAQTWTITNGAVTVPKMASSVTLDLIASTNATAGNVSMNSHRVTGLAATSSSTAASDAARVDQLAGQLRPSDHGMLAWTQPPNTLLSNTTLADGTTYAGIIMNPVAQTFANIKFSVETAMVNGTTHSIVAWIMDLSGNCLGVTSDFGSQFTTLNSIATGAFGATTATVPPGPIIWCLRYVNNTGSPTHPALSRGSGRHAAILGLGASSTTTLGASQESMTKANFTAPTVGGAAVTLTGWAQTSTNAFFVALT